MGDTLITVIAIFSAAILMFVFPLMSVSERNDDISQLAVQTATAEFVDQIATVGYISETNYNNYIQKLGATGNTYDVTIEVQILDENPNKITTTSTDLIGENARYSVYTNSILEKVNSSGKYVLKQGDNVIVTAKNTNKTMAKLLEDFMYKVTNNDTYQVAASASAMVVNSGN